MIKRANDSIRAALSLSIFHECVTKVYDKRDTFEAVLPLFP